MGKNLKGKELGNGLHQRNDGRYVGRFVNRFGKRIEISGQNIREVKNLLDTKIAEDKMHCNVIDDSIILDVWYEKWISIHKYNVIRENTRRHYHQIYTKHISPELGTFRINQITQLQIKGLIKSLDEQGYKFETQNKVRILLLDMFNKAMIDNFVIKNPARGITIKRDEEKDIKALTLDEQAIFFDCCKGTFYDNLFTVAVLTGLRPGELCALTWDDIDLKNNIINIDKTLVYQKFDGDDQKAFHIDPPKTKTSYRKVPINSSCEIALKKQKMQKDVIISKTVKKIDTQYKDLLFTTKYGTPINAQIYSDAIKRIIDEINLSRDIIDEMEYFSGHCFRHTFATRCFEAGIQPKTVQDYLGHASLKMTMDLYTCVFDDKKQTEIKKLDTAFETLPKCSQRIDEERYQKYKERSQKIKYINAV